MKDIYIGAAWFIGVVAIFGCMVVIFKIKGYFPFGISAILLWSFIIYKATESPKDKIPPPPNEKQTLSNDLLNINDIPTHTYQHES